jgi:tRNA1(Val) A37 N6-methylase TrmN6
MAEAICYGATTSPSWGSCSEVERVHEWCAGAGNIGFALLGPGLCDELSLSDVNPRAIEAMRDTVRRNRLEGRVKVYESDVLKGVPVDERWDLVVGNPPHHRVGTEAEYRANIRGNDPGWRLHRQFYATVAQFLKPSGSTLTIENYGG